MSDSTKFPSVSYSPFCMHCMGVSQNEIGETIVFCEEWDMWRNVTLGDCFGNCETQEVVNGGEPWEWHEPKEGT